jgi:hypothetical protein
LGGGGRRREGTGVVVCGRRGGEEEGKGAIVGTAGAGQLITFWGLKKINNEKVTNVVTVNG